MLRRASRWTYSRGTAGSSAASQARRACTALLQRPRQDDALRHRVLRRMGNAECAKPHHRDSDDRTGLYRASEVARRESGDWTVFRPIKLLTLQYASDIRIGL